MPDGPTRMPSGSRRSVASGSLGSKAPAAPRKTLPRSFLRKRVSSSVASTSAREVRDEMKEMDTVEERHVGEPVDGPRSGADTKTLSCPVRRREGPATIA